MSDVIVRRATLSDVEDMHRLINHFAGLGLMLPKPLSKLYQNIRDFFVAEKDEQFAGCGALHVIWNDLGEIRSLAVAEPYQKNGVGRRLAIAALQDAIELKLPRVFALTYQQAFFERLGFVEVDKSSMPQKVWGECMDCPKFPNCDEVAMIMDAPFLPIGEAILSVEEKGA
ncbi:MAG: N-acetyltransferase [Anaerolineae bacterium]|jgi:amino-acid N-acetyltransferase